MSALFPTCESCPQCASRNVESLPYEQITQLKKLVWLRCRDCGTTFEPAQERLSGETRPHIGDLLLRPRRDVDGFVIALLGASAAQETRCAARDDAVRLAARTAGLLRSTVWQTDDGVTFDLVASYRAHQ